MPSTKPQREAAAKPCHSCRRRRLRCDRSYPHCTKCVSRGIECLGYGQLFLWTGAVASRGKLAGRTSSAALYKDPVAKRKKDEAPTCSTEEAAETERPSYDDAPVASRNRDTPDTQDMQLIRTTPSVGSETSTPWTLVDPLFQDMRHSNRQYLAYFSSRLCLDLVAYDVPDRNPFRNLLPMTQAHPLLQQVIVAASAAHMCNQARRFLAPDSFSRGEGPSPWRIDALIAKQRALQMMPTALRSIESIGGDVILAAALFLVNVELLESGRHGWKPHLEGAGRIMAMIQGVEALDETLRDYIMSDCFVYYILGSALSPSPPDSHTYFQSYQALAVLEKATNSYFCCPPDVLEILLLASQLPNTDVGNAVSAEMVTSAGAALYQRALNIDILAWARKVRDIPSLNNASVGSRFRAGSAHRLAACLYIVQAIPTLDTWLGEGMADVLVDDFYHSLACIPAPDPNFKATAWPTFIFGATAKTPERQAWVMDRLQQLVIMCPWGFLYTAMDTLRNLWRLEAEGKLSKSWLQTLRDPEMNFLIV
ncbi:Fc.00g044320.m01.CDS01 [Cosmosporella sp. VM-42]